MDVIGELITKEIPSARLEIRKEQTDPRNYRVNFDPIAQELGFTPSHRVVDTVRDIWDAMRTGEFADFGSAQYSNHLIAVAQREDPERIARAGKLRFMLFSVAAVALLSYLVARS